LGGENHGYRSGLNYREVQTAHNSPIKSTTEQAGGGGGETNFGKMSGEVQQQINENIRSSNPIIM
jgi:hypothetical protein